MKKKKSKNSQRRSNKPPAFKQRVRNMSAQGISNKKISKALGICENTVNHILNEPEVKEDLEQGRLLWITGGLEAVKTAIKKMVEEGDMSIAYKILVSNGILDRELVPELRSQIAFPSNMNQLNFAQMLIGQRGQDDSRPVEMPRDEKTQMVIDLLAQMKGTADRHEIPISGNGKNGNKKVRDAELVREKK